MSSGSSQIAMTEPKKRKVGLILHDPSSSYNVYHAVRASMPEYASEEERDKIQGQAIERCCDIRMHRSFYLPPDPILRAKPFRVTYSDVGALPGSGEGDSETPVLLWASGMFGGRYAALELDELAKSYGVRVISVDRPGIGGTDLVPLKDRIATWLEIVPALMKHLGIKHVSLGCHSAGTIYTLSIIIHLRHLLNPKRPYMCMFGPWVEPQYSGKWDMKIVAALGEPLVGKWHFMAKTIFNLDKSLGPTLSSIAHFFKKLPPPPTKTQAEIDEEIRMSTKKHPITNSSEYDSTTCEVRVKHGPLFPKDLIVPASRFTTESIFNENIRGASDEALVCMGKGNIQSWTGIGNAIQQIAGNELARRAFDNGNSKEERPKLKIGVFYGMKDEMIGKGGQVYLDSCLEKADQQGALQTNSFVINKTNHNSVLDPETGAFDLIFAALTGKPGALQKDAEDAHTTQRITDPVSSTPEQ